MNLPVLAAWLYDIGIFAARARAPLPENPRTCETGLYTAAFIQKLLPLPPGLESQREQLARLAGPAGADSREGRLIRRAARLAAGAAIGQEEGKPVWLTSVFTKIRLGGKGLPAGAPPLHYRLSPPGEADALFPEADSPAVPDYAGHWQKFRAALANLPCGMGEDAWQASLVSLLERYCWCIPCGAETQIQDISLFDHAAAMAAITQALLRCPPGQERLLLFGGDLSGIQDFIFGREEPADKGAARLLRARSFLLQAVTRSIWLVLLQRLKLEPAAKIMDAGGRFALLLPDAPETRAQIQKLADEAEQWLLSTFQGAVRLNLAAVGLAAEDLGANVFRARFAEFGEALEAAKLKPFSHAFGKGLPPILPVDYAAYGQYGECAFCHTRPGASLDEEKPICGQCRLLRRLGAKLPGAGFIAFTRKSDPGQNSFPDLLFDGLGLRLYAGLPPAADVLEAAQILSVKDEPVFTMTPIAGHIPVITEADLLRWQAEGRRMEADSPAADESGRIGEPKTFSMLAQEARVPPAAPGEPWTCMPCLGICKADVDNLGLVFSAGLGDAFCLARYAMLARMLNYFFAGHLMRVVRKRFPNIYVVFAGGDDVFVIGPWREAIDFGLAMADDFRKFCGNNPAITISAGIPLIKHGLPMRHAGSS